MSAAKTFPEFVAVVWASDLGPPERLSTVVATVKLARNGPDAATKRETTLLVLEWPSKGVKLLLDPLGAEPWRPADERSASTPDALLSKLNRIQSLREDVRRADNARATLASEVAELGAVS